MKARRIAVWAVMILCAAQAARSSEIPEPGSVDGRIRVVDYDPNQVYRLVGFYGYDIAIFFAPDETVMKTAAGFSDAWDVTVHGNFVTVKPAEKDPDTNLLVVTDRRTYVFDLRARAPGARRAASYAVDPDQIFMLRFRYPAEERAAADAARARAQLQDKLAQAHSSEERMRLAALAQLPPQPLNRAYYFQGSNDLAPYEAWDDGVFTYLRFYAQQDLPAAFVVNEDNSEGVVNKHFDGDLMVIERTGKRFRLRKGQTVVCLWNEGPQLHTPASTSGATERGAERELREQ